MNFTRKQNRIILTVIIFAALGLRLWGITNPLLDFHHFRQTYTAMMAKNFYLYSMNIFFPSVDILEFNNIIEFQIYPFIVAVLYKIFGYHDIIGRIVSVAFSLGSLYYLYKLVKRFADDLSASIAAGLFAVLPMMVYYSRTFMLESAMIFLSIFSIYLLVRWLDTDKLSFFAASIVSSSLLLLIKIATAYMLLPMAFLIFNKSGWRSFRQAKNYIFLFLTLLPSVYWYILHVKLFPELAQQGGIAESNVTGGYLSEQMREASGELLLSTGFWSKIIFSRLGEYHLAYSGFLVLIAALFLRGYHGYQFLSKGREAAGLASSSNLFESGKLKNKWLESREQLLFYVWLFSIILFIIMFPAPNYAHEYYQLPVIPPSCAIIAVFSASIIQKIKMDGYTAKGKTIIGFFILLLIPIIVSTFIRLETRLQLDYTYLNFAEEIKKVTEKDDLILLWDIPRTEVFYYAERKGFTTHVLSSRDLPKIQEFKNKGAKYFVTPYAEFILYAPEVKAYLDSNATMITGHETLNKDFKNKLLMQIASKESTSGMFPGFIYKLN